MAGKISMDFYFIHVKYENAQFYISKHYLIISDIKGIWFCLHKNSFIIIGHELI